MNQHTLDWKGFKNAIPIIKASSTGGKVVLPHHLLSAHQTFHYGLLSLFNGEYQCEISWYESPCLLKVNDLRESLLFSPLWRIKELILLNYETIKANTIYENYLTQSLDFLFEKARKINPENSKNEKYYISMIQSTQNPIKNYILLLPTRKRLKNKFKKTLFRKKNKEKQITNENHLKRIEHLVSIINGIQDNLCKLF